jgi:hypothetical protein
MAFILESGKPDCGLLVLGEDAELADLIRGLGCPADMADDQRVEKNGGREGTAIHLGRGDIPYRCDVGRGRSGRRGGRASAGFRASRRKCLARGEMNRDWQDIVGRPSVRLLARNDDALSCAIDQLPDPGRSLTRGWGGGGGSHPAADQRGPHIRFIVNDVATAGQAFTLRFHEKHEWHIELWVRWRANAVCYAAVPPVAKAGSGV